MLTDKQTSQCSIWRCQRSALRPVPRAVNPERDSIIDYETLELAVPTMQRPVNELKQVREGVLFKWAALDSSAFAARLTAVFLAVFVLIGGPIAYQTFDPGAQLPEFVLAGTLGSLLVTTVVTLRIYLGWAYVRQRLLSASIEYEVCVLLFYFRCTPLLLHQGHSMLYLPICCSSGVFKDT
jgi:hypothetical protein